MTGDTLFLGCVDRAELGIEAGVEDAAVDVNAVTLYESLLQLFDRAGDPVVLPAHDPNTPDPPVAARHSTLEERNTELGRDRDTVADVIASEIPAQPPNFRRITTVDVGPAEVAVDEPVALEVGPNRCAAR